MGTLRNKWVDEGIVVVEDVFHISEIKKIQIDFEEMYGGVSQSK